MTSRAITFMGNGMPLSGLGCACQVPLQGVADYDILLIGGKQYSAGQIVDAQLTAIKDTPIYRRVSDTTPLAIIKKGQVIGKVYSYLKPSNSSGKAALMFYDGPNYTGNVYYALDESAVDTSALKDMGVKTVEQQVQEEAELAAKDNDPVLYYVKKIGLPVLLIGGGLYLVATFGKAFITGELMKPKRAVTPAKAA